MGNWGDKNALFDPGPGVVNFNNTLRASHTGCCRPGASTTSSRSHMHWGIRGYRNGLQELSAGRGRSRQSSAAGRCPLTVKLRLNGGLNSGDRHQGPDLRRAVYRLPNRTQSDHPRKRRRRSSMGKMCGPAPTPTCLRRNDTDGTGVISA